jgi:hypothetical protein
MAQQPRAAYGWMAILLHYVTTDQSLPALQPTAAADAYNVAIVTAIPRLTATSQDLNLSVIAAS